MTTGHFRPSLEGSMHRVLPFLAAIFMLGAIFAAPAVANDDSVCAYSFDWDAVIKACDRLIAARKMSSRDLAVTYSNRGRAYDGKGDYDRAIADYNESIRLNPKDAVVYGN